MDYYLVAGFLCWHSWAIWKSIYCSKLLQLGWPQAENAYVLKTLSGSILLTDGRTLISAEVWVFWVLALVPTNFSAKTTKDVTKMSLRCLAIWKVQICADNPLSGKISIRLTELSEQRSGPVEVFGPVQGQGHRAKMTLNWFKANSGNPCFYTSVHIITGKKHDFLSFFYWPGSISRDLRDILDTCCWKDRLRISPVFSEPWLPEVKY